MEHEIHNIFQELKKEGLTPVEKARLHNNLRLYMSEHPAHVPFSIRMYDVAQSLLRVIDSATLHRPLATAFALVLVVGVGTSYAAESAIPGDVLYLVKIRINEPVKGSLVVSQAARANWHTELVTRRLEEAEVLAAEDRLTPLARTQIQTEINRSSERFDETVAMLARSGEGEALVAEAQSNLEASLEGHEKVLTALAEDLPVAQGALVSLMANVRDRADVAQSARASAEENVIRKNDDTTRSAALHKKSDARDALRKVRAVAARKELRSASSTAASINTFVAEQALSDGEDKFQKGAYGEAFTTFQASLRATQSAQVDMEAERRLKIELRGSDD